jgi:glutaredoxin
VTAVIRVTVYGKRECHLCDEVKATLLAVQREVRFDLHEVDIEATPELRERYQERVPLVFVNGRLAFKFRMDEASLRRRLAREGLIGRLKDRLGALRPGHRRG